MKINFLVNRVFDGWEPTDTRLGGTEESIVRWAEELVKLGHDVEVHRDSRSKGTETSIVSRVWYKPRQHESDADVTINVKSPEVEPKGPTLYLTNETDAGRHNLSKFDAIIWPSEWALENIPVKNPRKFVLPHGYDSDKIYPGEKILKQCLYASSPDRGLDKLLEVWPSVMAAHPDATLLVTYGAHSEKIPGVMFLGELDEETMNELYRTSDVWCHPCNGGELFGITGVKAQAAGCVPVIIPEMALAETVRHGVFCTSEDYAEKLISTLSDEALRNEIRQKLAKEHYVDWAQSTRILLDIIASVV